MEKAVTDYLPVGEVIEENDVQKFNRIAKQRQIEKEKQRQIEKEKRRIKNKESEQFYIDGSKKCYEEILKPLIENASENGKTQIIIYDGGGKNEIPAKMVYSLYISDDHLRKIYYKENYYVVNQLKEIGYKVNVQHLEYKPNKYTISWDNDPECCTIM